MMGSSKRTTVSRWLLDAKDLKPADRLDIYLSDNQGPAPTFPNMRAALYAQYGEDTPIRIYKHGDHIGIFISSSPEERERFDFRSRGYVFNSGGKRLWLENGFVSELPTSTTPGAQNDE